MGYILWGHKELDMVERLSMHSTHDYRAGIHPLPQNGAQLSLVQSLSCVQLFTIPWMAAHQVFLSITNSQSSLKLTSIESVMPSTRE